MIKQFTLAQILDAMEKDGYKKITGLYVLHKDHLATGEVLGACALGQAGLNLEINPELLASLPDDIYIHITDLNDRTTMSVAAIARNTREKFKDRLNDILEVDASRNWPTSKWLPATKEIE